MKGKRVLTVAVEVTVDLDEVEYHTTNEWSDLYHDRTFRQVQHARVGGDIAHALHELSPHYAGLVVNVRHSEMDIHTNEEDLAAHEEMYERAEAESNKLFEDVDKLSNELNIAKCIWSMGSKHFGYNGDYRQMLLDNPVAFEGKVRFVYEGGWGDEEPIVDSVVLTNPTMHDVLQAADRCLVNSNDKHHVFVEGVEDRGVDSEGVHVYNFYFGS